MSRRLAWLGLASAFLNSNSSSMVVITTCSISWASCSSVLILQPCALSAARRRAGDREAGEEEAELRLFSCLNNSNKLPLTVRASLLEQVSSSQPWNDYFDKGQHYVTLANLEDRDRRPMLAPQHSQSNGCQNLPKILVSANVQLRS